MLLGDQGDPLVIGGETEEVHWDDGPRPEPALSLDGFEPLLEVVGIKVEAPAIHVDQDGLCPQQQHDLGGCRKGKGGQKDRIPGTDFTRHQAHEERVSPA